MNTKNKKKDRDWTWLWLIIFIGSALMICRGGGMNRGSANRFPFDTAQEESMEYYMDLEDEEYFPDYDPGEKYNNEYEDFSDEYYESNARSCPYGCTEYYAGCDIKGNINIETGEKIYHVPGSEYYGSTRVSPEYGERWFCTEKEAIANGWRRSYK